MGAKKRIVLVILLLAMLAGGAAVIEYLRQPAVGESACAPSDTDTRCYEGLTESEATKRASSLGQTVRVIEREGVPLPTTMDLRHDRLNFVVRGGKVVRVTDG